MSCSAAQAQALSSVPLSLHLFAFKAISQSHLIVPRLSARSLHAQALGSQQEGAHKLSGPLRARCDHREWQNARVLPYEQHAYAVLTVASDRGWKFPHPWLSPFLHTGMPIYLGGYSFEKPSQRSPPVSWVVKAIYKSHIVWFCSYALSPRLFFFLLSHHSSPAVQYVPHINSENINNLLCWKATHDKLLASSSFNPRLLTVPSLALSAFCSLGRSMHLHFYPTLGPTNNSPTSTPPMHWRRAQEW